MTDILVLEMLGEVLGKQINSEVLMVIDGNVVSYTFNDGRTIAADAAKLNRAATNALEVILEVIAENMIQTLPPASDQNEALQ